MQMSGSITGCSDCGTFSSQLDRLGRASCARAVLRAGGAADRSRARPRSTRRPAFASRSYEPVKDRPPARRSYEADRNCLMAVARLRSGQDIAGARRVGCAGSCKYPRGARHQAGARCSKSDPAGLIGPTGEVLEGRRTHLAGDCHGETRVRSIRCRRRLRHDDGGVPAEQSQPAAARRDHGRHTSMWFPIAAGSVHEIGRQTADGAVACESCHAATTASFKDFCVRRLPRPRADGHRPAPPGRARRIRPPTATRAAPATRATRTAQHTPFSHPASPATAPPATTSAKLVRGAARPRLHAPARRARRLRRAATRPRRGSGGRRPPKDSSTIPRGRHRRRARSRPTRHLASPA